MWAFGEILVQLRHDQGMDWTHTRRFRSIPVRPKAWPGPILANTRRCLVRGPARCRCIVESDRNAVLHRDVAVEVAWWLSGILILVKIETSWIAIKCLIHRLEGASKTKAMPFSETRGGKSEGPGVLGPGN